MKQELQKIYDNYDKNDSDYFYKTILSSDFIGKYNNDFANEIYSEVDELEDIQSFDNHEEKEKEQIIKILNKIKEYIDTH